MEDIKRDLRRGTKILKISIHDAIELGLFIAFLAAVLGTIFREKFIYLIFAAIILFAGIELRRYNQERKKAELKFDNAIEDWKKKNL